jgi:hypothetical protein
MFYSKPYEVDLFIFLAIALFILDLEKLTSSLLVSALIVALNDELNWY